MNLRRLPFLASSLLLLVVGLWAGEIRLGWAWPALLAPLPMLHGPLMVAGFLGSLIALERAIALGHRWTYGGPLLASAGGLLAALGATQAGALLMALGSLVFLATAVQIVKIQPVLHAFVIAAGALCLVVGNLLWLAGWAIPVVVYWWAAFLVLTIAGERLELSRFLRLPPVVERLFLAAALLLVVGLVAVTLSAAAPATGVRLIGLAWVLMALWLLRYDIARRRLHVGGQARFMGLALLVGFVWMGVAGLLALRFAGVQAGPAYDAMLHTLFIGFVVSMIFAHALIIFPVVLGARLPYGPHFYVPLLLLHGALVLRIAGDLLPWWSGRLWGGLLNGVAVLAFLATVALSLERVPVVAAPGIRKMKGGVHASHHSSLH